MELKLDSLDTSRCLIDPKRSDLFELTKTIPEFNIHNPYRLSVKGIIRYVILMYDADSPLWREVRSLPLRKAVSMELAGFKRDRDGKFDRPIEHIMEGKNRDVNSMLLKYLTMQNNPKWSQRCAYEHIYYMEIGRVMNGAYKTKEVIQALDQLTERIDSLTGELIGGKGEALPVLEVIYKEATKDLDCSPEKVSQYVADSDNVPDDWSSYAKWVDNELQAYKVDEIKFAGDK